VACERSPNDNDSNQETRAQLLREDRHACEGRSAQEGELLNDVSVIESMAVRRTIDVFN